MAKTKKKEKIVDLKSKPEKITEKQLKKVQTTVNAMNRIQLEIGSIESRKHNILHHISTLQGELNKLQVEFEKTYGTTDINIQDGTINYQKDNDKTD